MTFMTDRKRAEGTGSAKSGTLSHWHMMISSVGLLLLMPIFIFQFGSTLGGSYEEVVAYYSRPVPATIAALTMLVTFYHFRKGVQTLIEDYVHGFARKVLLITMICLSYGAAAFSILAVLRIAL